MRERCAGVFIEIRVSRDAGIDITSSSVGCLARFAQTNTSAAALDAEQASAQSCHVIATQSLL